MKFPEKIVFEPIFSAKENGLSTEKVLEAPPTPSNNTNSERYVSSWYYGIYILLLCLGYQVSIQGWSKTKSCQGHTHNVSTENGLCLGLGSTRKQRSCLTYKKLR